MRSEFIWFCKRHSKSLWRLFKRDPMIGVSCVAIPFAIGLMLYISATGGLMARMV